MLNEAVNDPVWLPRADDGLSARLVRAVGDRRPARPDLPAAAVQRGAGGGCRSRADAVLAERDGHHAARLCHRHGLVDRHRRAARHSHGPRQDSRRPARHVGQHLFQRPAFRAGSGADDPVRLRREDDRCRRVPVCDLDHRPRHARGRSAHLAVADRDGAVLRRLAPCALRQDHSLGGSCRKSSPASGSASSAASRAW